MLHMYGVSEQQIRDGWTVAQFRAYRDFALELMKNRRL
jgi:hypothetical protein